MDFGLSDDQIALAQAARRALTTLCPPSTVRQAEKTPTVLPALWGEFAKLGWIGIAVPEEFGGSGLTFVELCLLAEEFGRFLVPGPFFGVQLAVLAILDSTRTDLQRQMFPRIVGGEFILAPALLEPSGPQDPQFKVRAAPAGDGFTLSGSKWLVPDADMADALLASAVLDSGETDLFVVSRSDPAVILSPMRTIDTGRYFRVTLNRVSVHASARLGLLVSGESLADRLTLHGAAVTAAWSVGAASRVLEMTVEYAKHRTQFGSPIGRFQAIQHRCANMAIECDVARFLTYQAAWRISQARHAERETAMAKARANRAILRTCLESQQVHGAIGFTREYDLQLYTRRAAMAQVMYGDTRSQQERVAASLHLGGAVQPDPAVATS